MREILAFNGSIFPIDKENIFKNLYVVLNKSK